MSQPFVFAQRRPAPRGVARSFSAHQAPAGNHRPRGGSGSRRRRRHNNHYNNNNNSLVAPSCFNSAMAVKLVLFVVGFLSTATFSVFMYWRAKAQLRPHQMIGIAQQQQQQQRGSLLRLPTQQQQQQEASSSRTRQSFSKPSKQQPQQRGDNNKPPKNQNWLNPRTSHPPMAMDLTQLLSSLHDNDNDDDDHDKQSLGLPAWQRHRFTCLAHIRRVQNQTLHDIMLRNNNNNNSSSSSSSNHESSSSLAPFNLVLIDPAYHANVGDHMITVAEQVYLQQLLVVHHHHHQAGTWRECSYFQAGPWAPLCQTELSLPAFYHGKTAAATTTTTTSNTNVALWHGGGNWGDLWDSIHTIRTASMTTLLDLSYTQIIGMPQSLYFVHAQAAVDNAQAFRRAVMEGLLRSDNKSNKNKGDSSSSLFLDNAQLTAALRGRLVLTWREQESLEQATKLYPYVQHVLVPDIAFQLGPFNATALRLRRRANNTNTNNNNIPPQVDVLWFLRTDAESVYAHQRDRQSIRQMLSQNPTTSRFTYSIVDWNDRLDRFDSNDYYFTDTAIQLLDSGRVVICDRLHAAVLAYLSGIPFVMVDQVSGKLTKTFRVAMRVHDSCRGENAMWDRADNLTDALTKAAVLWEGTKSNNAR